MILLFRPKRHTNAAKVLLQYSQVLMIVVVRVRLGLLG